MEEPPRLNSDTNSSWTILRAEKKPTLVQVFQAGTSRAPRSLWNCSAFSYVHCSLVLKSAQEGRGKDAVRGPGCFKRGKRGEKRKHSQMEKENPITLHLFSPLHTSETRLPTQTRFTTTTRNLRSNPDQRNVPGSETEACLFIPRTARWSREEQKEPDFGRASRNGGGHRGGKGMEEADPGSSEPDGVCPGISELPKDDSSVIKLPPNTLLLLLFVVVAAAGSRPAPGTVSRLQRPPPSPRETHPDLAARRQRHTEASQTLHRAEHGRTQSGASPHHNPLQHPNLRGFLGNILQLHPQPRVRPVLPSPRSRGYYLFQAPPRISQSAAGATQVQRGQRRRRLLQRPQNLAMIPDLLIPPKGGDRARWAAPRHRAAGLGLS